MIMRIELPIWLRMPKYEPIRREGWEFYFTLPPQVLDYEEYIVDNFLRNG